MTSDLAFGLVREMLWTAMLVSAPVIGVAMAVGLVISIFQVVTQIQEMTLTFIPKLLAIFLVIVMLGSWMLAVLVEFGVTLFSSIPDLVK